MSTVGLSGNNDIDGILWGVKWDFTSLTFGFATATSQYLGYPIGGIQGFQAFSATQRAAATDIIAIYNSIIDIPITFVSNGADANLRFAEATFVDQGNGLPGNIPTAVGTPPDDAAFPPAGFGDMFYNRTDYNNPVIGNFAYHTLMHELGHAMGLKHGHVTQTHPNGFTLIPKLPNAHDSMEFSVMTYRSNVGATADFYHNENFGYAQTLMMDDIAALQYLYGADYGFRSGDTTYKWSKSTGEMTVNGVGQGTPGANRVFLTTWDGGGKDTYDMSNYSTNVSINLAPGGWSITSQNQLATLNTNTSVEARGNVFNSLLHNNDLRSVIENAIGGTGNDKVLGNGVANTLSGSNGNDVLGGGKGNDRLYGGNGNDVLKGGEGTDRMNAGAGSDRFDFDRLVDSANNANRDDVFGFTVAGGTGNSFIDRLDFSTIDARAGTGGNNAFIYVGDNAFTGEGQIRAVQSGGSVIVQINSNGAGGADMMVELLDFNVNQLTKWDFVL